MLPNSYIKVFYTFAITVFIVESTLSFVNNIRYKFFWNAIFQKKSVWYFVSTLKRNLYFATIALQQSSLSMWLLVFHLEYLCII